MVEQPLLHNRYRILRRLGSGAFATVYLADDTRMERQVAVKVVSESVDADGRALREARAAAKLNHPHIVHVFEVVPEEDRTLLFTEYVQGETLRSLYAARRLDDHAVLQVGVQVCRALEHGHKRGVIHRDIKPENLMLLDAEEVDVRVMDFGVAHLEDHAGITRQGDVVGTLAYMAPEQLAGLPVDPKADVYALCVTLYEGLTGGNPLRGKSLPELVNRPGLQQLPPLRTVRPDLPAVLDGALHDGLAAHPDDRLTVAGLRKALERALRELPEEPAPGPTLTERTAEALAPGPSLERLSFLGRRLLSGALGVVALAHLVEYSGLIPADWQVPLLFVAGFACLLVPMLGGALVVALYAVAAFAFGVGWGVAFLLVSAPVLGLLRLRGREWIALLPLAGPWLAAGWVGLAIPPLAGFAARRWGFLVSGLAGLAIAVSAGFTGWRDVPMTYTTDVPPDLLSLRYAGNPGDVVEGIAGLLDANPELLLQTVLFGAFAAPLARLVAADAPPLAERRRWGVALYLAAVFAAFVVLPPVATGAAVDLGRFFLAFLPCVIILTLFGLLIPAEERHATLER